MKIKKIKFLECNQCEHEWIPRSENKKPKKCPHCYSLKWDKPKQDKIINEMIKSLTN